MQVTLSNRDVLDGLILLQAFKERALPVALSYAMAKTVRKLKGLAEVISEERQRIVKEHQKVNSKGERILTEEGDVQLDDPLAFAEDIKSLFEEENEVDVHSISLSVLEGLKDVKGKSITPSTDEMEGLLLLQMLVDDSDSKDDSGE